MNSDDYNEMDALLADYYRAQYQLTIFLNGPMVPPLDNIWNLTVEKHKRDMSKTRQAMAEFIIKLENRLAKQIPAN